MAEAGGVIDESSLEILAGMASDPDPEVRGRAAAAMGRTGNIAAVPVLVELIGDADERVRLTAIASLGDVGDPVAVEPLLPLLEEGSTKITCQALAALAKIGDQRVFAPVIARVFDVDDDVRKNAVVAAGCLADPRATEPLLMCLGDDSAEVRASSAWALGKLGSTEAVDALMELSDSGDAEDVRANAVTALANIGLLSIDDDPDSSARALTQVVDVLDDSSEAERVRIAAAIASASIAREAGSSLDLLRSRIEAAFGLLCALGTPEDLRSTCIWGMGRVFEGSGDAVAVSIVSTALDDGGEWSVRYAVEALALIGGQEALRCIESFASSDRSQAYSDLCTRALDRLNA